MLTLDKFEEASEKVREVTLETKLVYSDYLMRQSLTIQYIRYLLDASVAFLRTTA